MPDDALPAAPTTPTTEYCYRHPHTATGVHCTRCGRPICTECMIPAPVGYQCPECVGQARREFRRGPVGPLRGGVSVTKVLLVAIAVPFVLETLMGGPNALFNGPDGNTLIDLGAMQPLLIAHGQYWRLFSAMFLHLGLLHIGFNAYALWLFGRMVESEFGHAKALLIYLVSGFLASVASYAFGDVVMVAVGASGAIFGIFGAFIAYNYRRRHLAMASANLRWAMTLILINAFLAFTFRGIDWRAHVGGLVAGVACGVVAEGWGTAARRRLIAVLGFAGLIALGTALVVWRTNEIRALPLFAQIFG
jgi:membrane associated rhomboid family serine protease